MFGDIFAGSMLTAFGLYLIWAAPTKGSIVEAMYSGRYFLFMMGFFSIFCGLCYNDFTSLPTYMFGSSCYTYT
jgi:V-type H+-transporting ATPase subunit a